MRFPSHPHSFSEFRENMDAYGVEPALQEQFGRCLSFHSEFAPGLFIGVFMVDFALELLGAHEGEKLYTTVETYKCIPDPVQVMTGCTFGNHRLQIVPIGKFALTMNRPSEKEVIEGVRVFMDGRKLKKYKIINAWYTHTPGFDSNTMIFNLIDEILQAGRYILSYQRVLVNVPLKKQWKSVPCATCGEFIPNITLEENRCRGCGSMKYYNVIHD